MAPDISAAGAPAGDVATAIMEIDSFVKRVHGSGCAGGIELDITSVVTTPNQARELLDGYCTVIYLFITGWRKVLTAHGKDVLKVIIPDVVDGLRHMTRTVEPATIPTMAAMLTAAAMEASPNRWRAQFGEWQFEELAALQATAVLLAEGVNNAHGDPDAALSVIMDALHQAEHGDGTTDD